MATLTLTMSQLSPNVKATHTGVNQVAAAWSRSSTFTPSNVLQMVRVPNGATLLDWWMRIATGGANQTLKIGTSVTRSGIMSVTTLCQTFSISTQAAGPSAYGIFNQGWLRAPGGTQGGSTDLMPVRISLSDDAQPANVWIQAKLGAAISNSAFVTFVLFYTCDGTLGHTTIGG